MHRSIQVLSLVVLDEPNISDLEDIHRAELVLKRLLDQFCPEIDLRSP